MRIGIVSENYKHDSEALKLLLNKQFAQQVIFIPILKQVTGDNLLTPKTARLINEGVIRKKLNLVLLAKDLDDLPSAKKKIAAIKEKSKKIIKAKLTSSYLLFLMIFELESLILADIATFNKLYDINYQFDRNPMYQKNPKELLKQKTAKNKNKYRESDAPKIFQELNFQKVYNNHKGENSFQSFIDELEKEL